MLLVTGITGFSGTYFLKELIKHNYQGPIRCVVREKSDTTLLDSNALNIEKVVGDLTNLAFLEEVTVGVDTILHMGISKSIHVTKAAIKNNVKRMIFIHTAGVYSNYKALALTYKQIERRIDSMIQASPHQHDLIYLRPTMIFGYLNDRNMIRFIKMVDRFRIFPIIARGKNLLQPVHGRDLGKAYYQVLMTPSITRGDYVLSGEVAISMRAMLSMISTMLGKKTMFVSVPLYLSVFLSKCAKKITLSQVDYVEEVQRMGEDRHLSHEKAQQDFGYTPGSFQDGLQEEIKAYRDL